ncbi:thioredoxin domain-containing protein [Aquimarina sp. M1]
MKTILYLLTFVTISSPVIGQSFNQEINTTKGVFHLVGKINFQKLNTAPYHNWFSKNYESYTPNEKVVHSIKTSLQEYTIIMFMGTWCGDSKKEVPSFYKVLNASGFPINRLTTIAVQADRKYYKQSTGGEHEGLNIHRVPTFIFYKNGKEVNRIVESPKKTIEEDISDILSGNYTPNYPLVTKVNTIIETQGLKYLAKYSESLAKEYSSISKSLYELNTYANVLFYTGKKKEAVEILKFNILLFPNEAETYISLANKLVVTKDIPDAIMYYEKSLTFEKNEEINTKLAALKKLSK